MDNVQEYETIVNSIDKDTKVFVIDSTKDALEQMASVASAFSNIDAVHIFSHGDSGELNFGQTKLNQENITSYSSQLAKIGSSLSSNGDILLYGCNVANGATGIEFINKLSQITNADIASSDDLTGNSALGGDWVLEAHSGSIETTALSVVGFNGVLTDNPNAHITNPNTQLLGDINGTWPTGGVSADPGEYNYASYTYIFTATLNNTLISFMINNDPSYVYLDDIVVYDNADGSHTNLILNGNFSGGSTPVGSVNIPDNWMAIGQQGLNAAGTLQAGEWYDGAVGGFDGIAQAITTTVGHTYTITFNMKSDTSGTGHSYDSAQGVEVEVYAGPLPGGVSVLGSANHAPTISTGSNSLGSTAMSSASTAQKVGDILGLSGVSYADSDGTATKGIAITSTTAVGSGSWQYSADGSTGWANFTASSASSAIFLDQNYYVRFNASSTAGTTSFTYIGWDESDGNSSGGTADVSTRGNTTAYSSNTHTINLSVSSGPTVTTPTAASYTDTSANDTFTNTIGTISATGTITGYGINGGTTGGTDNIGGTVYDVSKVGTYGTLYTNSTTGAYVYVPNATAINAVSANQSETFSVQATDSNGTGSATLTVNVTGANDAPSLSTPTAASYTDTTANDTFTNTTGTLSASDRDTGATLTYGITGGTTGGSTNIGGTVYDVSKAGTYGTLYVKSSDGSYVFVPSNSALNGAASGATPSETFTMSVSDGTTSATQTYTVNVTGANDSPIISGTPANATVSEDTASNLNLSAITLSESDGDTLTVTLTASAGTMAASSGGGVTVGGSASGTLTLTGTASAIDTFLNTSSNIQYTSASNASGNSVATITITATDGNGASLASNPSVTINVTGTNDAPTVANAISDQTASVDSVFSYQFASNTFNDIDGDTLTYTATLANGNAIPAWLSFNAGTRTFSGTPTSGDTGTISIKVTATDNGTGTLSIFDTFDISVSANPTVTISIDDDTLKSGQTGTVTFTFSEVPTGFADGDITVTGGTLSSVSSTNSTHYTATFTPTPNTASLTGSISISAAAFTGSGNDSLASNTLSITGDTLVPTAPTITSLASSSDSTPTLTGTTEANATVTVVIAGATYTTTANGSGEWSVDTGSATPHSGTLAINANGNNSVSVTATDTAGNISTATTQTLAIDTTAPIFQSAATNNDGTKVILTYDSTLYTTTAGTGDFTVQVAGQTVVVSSVAVSGSTVELTLASAITNAQTITVAYAAPASNSATSNSAVQDSSGNDAASLTTTSVTNSVPAPSSGGGSTQTTPTTPPTTTVDGATIQTTTTTETRTTTDANGHTTDTTVSTEKIIIAPVTSNRVEQTGNATTADVPLFWGESTRTEWATTASIPTGVGLTSEGSRSPAATQTKATALDDLIYYIDTTAPSTDSSKTTMLGGGETFLQALSNIETLVVNKITLSATDTQASQTPITITGVANTITTTNGAIAPQEALVIDAQTLPSNSTLQLQNVEFAVIIGENITIRGGEGKNILFSGEGSQDIMLGADDDELHAGAGDDTVGSAGGDDKIFGEAGNDTVFGGEGNDMLHGGSGNDIATYSGNMADYIITRDEGKTYVALASNPNEIDTLINVETIKFADSYYTVENRIELTKIATLYMQVLDRQAEIDGFQYWAKNNTISLGNIALNFLTSDEYKSNSKVDWETLDTAAKVEQFYEAFLGRASDAEGKSHWINALSTGMTFEQVAQEFINSIEMQGIYQPKDDWNFSL